MYILYIYIPVSIQARATTHVHTHKHIHIHIFVIICVFVFISVLELSLDIAVAKLKAKRQLYQFQCLCSLHLFGFLHIYRGLGRGSPYSCIYFEQTNTIICEAPCLSFVLEFPTMMWCHRVWITFWEYSQSTLLTFDKIDVRYKISINVSVRSSVWCTCKFTIVYDDSKTTKALVGLERPQTTTHLKY